MSSPVARKDLPFILQCIDVAIENVRKAQYLFEEVAHPICDIDQRGRIIDKVCILEARVRRLAESLKDSSHKDDGHIQELQLVSQDPRVLGFTKITEDNLEICILQHLHRAEIEIHRSETALAEIAAGNPAEVPGLSISARLENSCHVLQI